MFQHHEFELGNIFCHVYFATYLTIPTVILLILVVAACCICFSYFRGVKVSTKVVSNRSAFIMVGSGLVTCFTGYILTGLTEHYSYCYFPEPQVKWIFCTCQKWNNHVWVFSDGKVRKDQFGAGWSSIDTEHNYTSCQIFSSTFNRDSSITATSGLSKSVGWIVKRKRWWRRHNKKSNVKNANCCRFLDRRLLASLHLSDTFRKQKIWQVHSTIGYL